MAEAISENNLKNFGTLSTNEIVELIHNEILKSIINIKDVNEKISAAIDLIKSNNGNLRKCIL